MSALQQYLSPTNGQGLLDFFPNGLKGKDIGILIRFFSIKSAERTVGNTDIRVVDITVYDIGYGFILLELFPSQPR